jgi:hypothetical protein
MQKSGWRELVEGSLGMHLWWQPLEYDLRIYFCQYFWLFFLVVREPSLLLSLTFVMGHREVIPWRNHPDMVDDCPIMDMNSGTVQYNCMDVVTFANHCVTLPFWVITQQVISIVVHTLYIILHT